MRGAVALRSMMCLEGDWEGNTYCTLLMRMPLALPAECSSIEGLVTWYHHSLACMRLPCLHPPKP